jgi:dTDP-glucose 4,6-dehydratase
VRNPLSSDLDFILAETRQSWESLRGQRLFLTGGTGFFGCWLLESFAWANAQLDLGATAVVLTRNPEAFARKAPHLATHPAIKLHTGDVRSFDYPAGEFARIIHAANDPSPALAREAPLEALDTIVQGTRHTLEFARRCGAREFLLTSSGAVYGPQPPDLSDVPEDYPGGPDPTAPGSLYGEGKRLAEMLCVLYNEQHGLRAKIARCFAFVGPYLPLEANFAIGNFIRDGLAGGPIRVQGDGTPYRSYLYAADLAVWLWTILVRGQPGRPYNVGAEQAISIGDLARLVAGHFRPVPEVKIAGTPTPGAPASRYVPSTARAREELGLRPTTGLHEAVQKTIAWHVGATQARSRPG